MYEDHKHRGVSIIYDLDTGQAKLSLINIDPKKRSQVSHILNKAFTALRKSMTGNPAFSIKYREMPDGFYYATLKGHIKVTEKENRDD